MTVVDATFETLNMARIPAPALLLPPHQLPEHQCNVTDDPMWAAGYADGTQILECNGVEDHAFADVDLDKLEWFALVPRHAAENPYAEIQHVVKQTEGTKVIFFRRRQIELGQVLSGGPQQWVSVPVLGLKVTVGDRVAKVYEFFMPNGSTLLSDDYQAI